MTQYIRYLFGVVLCIFFVSQLEAQQISYAEYFFDNDPGRGNGTSLSITAGNSLNTSFSISTSGLSDGIHKLYIRTKSNDGLWSLNAVRIISISPTYNSATAKIISAEYFIDTDPGIGNATVVSFTPNDTISIQKSISSGSFSPGFHQLFLRTKNGYGKWSLNAHQVFFVKDPNSTGQIVSAEYFFDADPGIGNGTAISVNSGNTISHTSTISTAGLGSGMHFLTMRVKDSNGKWSINASSLVYISQLISDEKISGAEYFFDNDPGFGNGISITLTSSDSVTIANTINTSSLSTGVHFFNLRVKNVAGNWSLMSRNLIYTSNDANIMEAEYFFDEDPGYGNGTALTLSNGSSIDVSAAIASSSLAMGSHIFYIRVKDSVGNWSANSQSMVYVHPTEASLKINSIEYSVDTIMPFGQGSRVDFSGMDSLDYTFSFTHGITDTFYHQLYVHLRDVGGRWSMVDSLSFRLENCIIPTAVFNVNDFCFGDSLVIYNNSLQTDTTTIYAWDVDIDGFIESTDSVKYVFNPSTPGTYKLSLKVTNFVCIDTNISAIHVFPKPDNAISIFGNNTFCPGSFSVLSANTGVGFQYQWLKNGNLIQNANSNFYQAQDSGDYRAIIKNMYNCTDTTPEISLAIYDLPSASITVSGSNSICAGDSVELTSIFQSGITYQWYFNGDTIANAHNNSFWAKNAGDYKLKITNINGCSDISTTISIVVNPVPVATVQAGGNTTLCDGENVVLYGSNGTGFTYQWFKDGAAVSGATSSFLSAISTGNYKVKITNAYQCTDTSTEQVITVNPSPVSIINFTGTATVCQGDSVTLHAFSNPTYTYQWFSYGTTLNGATDSVLTVIQTGNYTVKATNNYNCSSISTGQIVTVNPVPGASVLPLGSTSFCQGDSVALQANAGNGLTYNWFKNGNPIIGQTANLFIADSSGNYTAKVTNIYNCYSESQAVTVTVFPIPTANFSIPSVNCLADTIPIQYTGSASGQAFYNWNFGGGIVLNGYGQGPYNVIWQQAGAKTVSLVVSENGCVSNTETQSTSLLSVPSFITAPVTSVCQGDSVILTANSGMNLAYQWYQGGLAMPNDTLPTLKVINTGLYQVKVTSRSNGCYKLSLHTPVTINTTDFSLAFTSSATSFSQPPFNITISNQTPNLNNYNFLWELGDGTTSTFFNPIHSYQYNGDYTISLYAENASTGCRDTLIKSNYISCSGGAPNPCNILAAITPAGPVTICGGDSVLLTASAGTGYSYQWVYNNMIISGSTNQTFYAKQAGNYRVIITDPVCSQTSPAFVLNHYPSIQPVIQATGQIQPCTFDSLQLSLFVSYNNYYWSTGDTTSSVWVSQTGYYQVAVTDNYGCNLLSQPYVVNNSFLNPPEICIVGVDSLNHNRLVWERQSNALIDSFYIYREGFIANSYNKIGAIPFTQTSLFVDTNSNPAVQSYRYKIAAVDTCGGVTLLSSYHKTIHLTINAGLNGSWNLIWDGYQGFQFSTYRIYRGTSATNMSLLTQLPSTATSYTDLNPPSGTVYYQIEVLKSSGCYPDTVNSKANTNYNTSRSNTANNGSIAPIYLAAAFTANVQTGQWPIQVSFTDQSTGSPNSWKWDFGDGNTSISQNPIHTYNNTGLYTVKLKVCNGSTCDTTSKIGYINVLPNGMVEIDIELGAKLYPNPNDGNFTLDIYDKSSRLLQLYLYNTVGEVIHFEQFESRGNTTKLLKLSVLPKGVYFIHLNSSEGVVYRQKVVIQ